MAPGPEIDTKARQKSQPRKECRNSTWLESNGSAALRLNANRWQLLNSLPHVGDKLTLKFIEILSKKFLELFQPFPHLRFSQWSLL